MLCHNEPLRHPTWTIGCSADVKAHTRNLKTYFVEFIDVGGTSKHQFSRNVFYHQANGIILVHDVSNRKSYHNLWRWVAEVLHSEAYKEGERALSGSWSGSASGNWGSGSGTLSGSSSLSSSSSFMSSSNGFKRNEFDFELQIGGKNLNVPILVVGTKADLVKQELTGRQRRYSIVDEYGGDCVNVCTLASTHFTQTSIAAKKFDTFFDKIIDKKFGTTLENLPSPTVGSFASSSALSNTIRTLSVGPTATSIPIGSPGVPSGYVKRQRNSSITLSNQSIIEDASPLRSSSLRQQYLSQSQQSRYDAPLRSPSSASGLRQLYNNNHNHNNNNSNSPSRPPLRGSSFSYNGLPRSSLTNNSLSDSVVGGQ